MTKYQVIGPGREIYISNIINRKKAVKFVDQLSRRSGKKFSVRSYKAPARARVRKVEGT